MSVRRQGLPQATVALSCWFDFVVLQLTVMYFFCPAPKVPIQNSLWLVLHPDYDRSPYQSFYKNTKAFGYCCGFYWNLRVQSYLLPLLYPVRLAASWFLEWSYTVILVSHTCEYLRTSIPCFNVLVHHILRCQNGSFWPYTFETYRLDS